MKTKYEIIQLDQTKIPMMRSKTHEMFFNATQMAKPFGKDIREFLRSEPVNRYINAILNEGNSHIKTRRDLILIKRGRYGGTWLHKELAFEFAGWCSAIFRRRLHKWVEERMKTEADWHRQRLEAKTGFLPMTDAILQYHDPAKPYHFSNEANLINRIIFNMPAKQFKKEYQVENVRDACTAEQLQKIGELQFINTGLIKLGMDYQERKERLTRYNEHGQERSLIPIENALCSRQALQRA